MTEADSLLCSLTQFEELDPSCQRDVIKALERLSNELRSLNDEYIPLLTNPVYSSKGAIGNLENALNKLNSALEKQFPGSVAGS